ncbi:unnamed protein product [Ixodes persulcatus]
MKKNATVKRHLHENSRGEIRAARHGTATSALQRRVGCLVLLFVKRFGVECRLWWFQERKPLIWIANHESRAPNADIHPFSTSSV